MKNHEPHSLDEQFGPGAESADARAAHDEEIAKSICDQFGVDAYNIGDQEIDTLYEIIFEALKRGREEIDPDFDALKQEHERVVADIKGAHRVLHDAGVRHLSDEENQHPLGLSARISLLFGERDRLRQELSGRASVQSQSTEEKDK